MNKRIATYLVVAVVLVAASIAALQTHANSAAPEEPLARTASPEPAPALPPNHPSVAASSAPPHPATTGPATDEAAAIVWTPPPMWKSAPNPSSMRIATYLVPGPAGSEPAELSVSRAGGTPEANIQRWIGQFDGSAVHTRQEKTVAGLKVTTVSITGNFLGGGMMPGAPSAPHDSWGLLGAIVETAGSSYFFKLTGPAATIGSARAPFDSMIAGIARP